MTLARAWRRQLSGASSAALIVPVTMLAALVVLALGGGFSQVGVLGQIFAGPPAPSVDGAAGAHAHGAAARSSLAAIPVIPGNSNPRPSANRPDRRGVAVPVSAATPGRAGTSAPIVTQGVSSPVSRPVAAPPASPAPTHPPAGSTPPSPSPSPPSPSPSPQPTPVDQVVKVVTSVTQQVPAPAGPAATQAVQAAGSTADGLLGPGASTPPAPVVP